MCSGQDDVNAYDKDNGGCFAPPGALFVMMHHYKSSRKSLFSCPSSSIPTLGLRLRRLADFRIRTQIVTFET